MDDAARRTSDDRAESPQETRARVRLRLAGFPPPVPQYEVLVDGRFLARVDLAWPEARVAVRHLTTADLREPRRFDAFCTRLRHALDERS